MVTSASGPAQPFAGLLKVDRYIYSSVSHNQVWRAHA